jgi:hypothetical protein
MVFNNGLPDSSLFCCISLLCLPHCLSAHMTCTVCSSLFMLCAPCPFTAQFLFCAFLLLRSASLLTLQSFYTRPQQLQQATTTLLFSVPCIYSFCASCACNIRHSSACSHRADILHLSSALPDHHGNSSASLAVFPRVQHHWVLC